MLNFEMLEAEGRCQMLTSSDLNSKERAIMIAFRMLFGEKINAKDTATVYGVSKRTILRDISSIRHALSDNDLANYRFELKYNENQNNYSIYDNGILTLEEALLVLMTLTSNIPDISSDSLNKILKEIANLVETKNRRKLNGTVINAQKNYLNSSDKSENLSKIKQFLPLVVNKKAICFTAEDDRVLTGIPLNMFVENRHCYILMYVAGDFDHNVVYQIDQIHNLEFCKEDIKIS